MRRGSIVVIALALLHRPAAADPSVQCQLSGQVADVHSGVAIAGARVVVSDRSGARATATSDGAGRYRVDLPPGDYAVVFEYGASRIVQQVSVTERCASTVNGGVDDPGEVIVIQDHKPPKVPPRPINFSPRRAPPYSDAAVERDAWTRAWMLLDVNASGEVTRFKFLKRPGYDLEDIATREVFKLRFEPARDDAGAAMPVRLVWGIEWPAAGWLLAFEIPRTMMPPMVGFPPRSKANVVMCRGAGPLNLDSVHPTYRDCAKPDLSQAAHEAWIVRP